MQQTTPHIPDDLQQAINQIYLWVKDRFPSNSHFDIRKGLCHNIAEVTDFESFHVNLIFWGFSEFPFDGSWYNYSSCKNKYTNPKRLAWLQEHQTVE